jgi:hypothetical protein
MWAKINRAQCRTIFYLKNLFIVVATSHVTRAGVYIGCAIDDEMLFNTEDQKYFDFHFANFMLRCGEL